MEDPDAACPSLAMDEPDPAYLQEAMQVPVTVWQGAMGALLRKLHLLMAPGQSLAPDLVISEGQIRLLKVLFISLKDMSEDDGASFMARWWMKMVRELCYDTEDHLDEPCGAGAHQDFSELLARAKDAIKSGETFLWAPKTMNPNSGEAGFSRLTYPELPVPIRGYSIVGVDELPNKLVKLLDLDGEDKALRVIPISGCAGVGKTTIARTLFHNHGVKFQYRAFVTVSPNPDMRVFLTNMLSQLKTPLPHGFPDVPDLIDAISKHLQGKRYLIVVDDLWTASVWDIIRTAFPCGDCCSRIITTTQIDDVAQACCGYDSDCTYKMEPLDDHDSKRLFFATVFGSQYSCHPDFKELSYEIIRKCGGLPFAIVNIASLLASESNNVMEKWKYIQDSLPSTSVVMQDVLNLMYNSLPRRLRTCLLYLSMYAQGCVIKKDELVNLWVAEDFLSPVEGQETQKIADGYFDDLVSRGLIQAVDTNNNGEVLSCTVHQMVLDFIRHKSMEQNFVITVDYFQSTLSLSDKVRRLSVQFGGVKSAYIPESIETTHVRSLIFWGFFKCLPSSFMDYGLLRVLILHIWADRDKKSFDLTTIGKLFLLKYLKIECNITVKLPSKIRRLQYLGTLQVDARLSAVPSDIVNLKRLLHLCIPNECILPRVVGQLTSLRSHSKENVLNLGGLTNLQDLQLTCSVVQPEENLKRNVQHLASILDKLSALKSLTLVPAASGSTCVSIPEHGFSIVSPTPDLPLRKIELSRHCCIFFSLPKWFGELRNLCILKIAIRRLSRNDIDMLKGLPGLTALTLYIQTVSEEKMVIDVGGFYVLTYFKFMCAAPCLFFVPGAMPKVQKLTLCFNAKERGSYTVEKVAFSHLTALTEVLVKLGVRHADDVNIKGIESALKDTLRHHANTVMLRVQCVDVIVYCEDDKSTTTQEVNKKTNQIEEDKKETTESSEKHVSKLWPVDSRSREEATKGRSMEIAAALVGALATAAASKLSTVIENLSSGTDECKDAEYIKNELRLIEAFIKCNTPKGPSGHANSLQEEIIAQLRRLAYDIEDCIDSFEAKKMPLKDFTKRIRQLKIASVETRVQINSFMQMEKGFVRTAQGAVVGNSQEAVVLPIELQNLFDDPSRQVWLAKNIECLLYLCLFPPNHDVRTNALKRKWLAEGLVEEEKDAAENLKILATAGIISSTQTSGNGDVKICRLNEKMHACISEISKSQNFLVVFDGATSKLKLAEDARRLSVHPPANVQVKLNLPRHLSYLRTLVVCPADGATLDSYEDVLDFSRYEVLRVLDLKEFAHLTKKHLEDIVLNHSQKLLKYLSINLGSIDGITKKISLLSQLETLDLSGTKIVTVFKEVLLLPKLKHLLGKFQFSKIETVRSDSGLKEFLRDDSKLETLDGFVTGTRYGFQDLMSLMKRLRKVKIWCKSEASKAKLDVLSTAITEFIRGGTDAPHHGRSLMVDFAECKTEFMHEIKVVAGILDSLKLRGKLSPDSTLIRPSSSSIINFTKLPPFVAKMSAIKELCLCSTGLSWEVILEGLLSVGGLKCIKLVEDELGSINILSGHFRSIQRISIVSSTTLDIAIEADALPVLVSLRILCQNLAVIPGTPGIEIAHMEKLQEVALHPEVVDAIRTKWKQAVDGHPNKPVPVLLAIKPPIMQT